MVSSFHTRKSDSGGPDALALISALCALTRNELLNVLHRDLPPSSLAIVFAIITSRTFDWMTENSIVIDYDELLEKIEEVWLIEGLGGFFNVLNEDDQKNGRLFFRSVFKKIDNVMDEIVLAEMGPLEAIQHVRNSLGPVGDPFDDERVGPPLLKYSLKAWISVPEACRTVFGEPTRQRGS